jgi:hypothetical protein
MTTYRAYGRVIASDRPLPELERLDGSPPPDLTVAWKPCAPPAAPARWTTLWRFSTGEPWVTTSVRDGVRYVRFGRYLDCAFSDGGIDVVPRGYAADTTLRHLILDQALPLALAARGSLVVHASAVADGTRAILLAGRAGTGKSTLAALLARSGLRVLADDGVLVERSGAGIRAVPSYPGLRVYRDSAAAAGVETGETTEVAEYTRKLRVFAAGRPPDAPAESITMAAIYVLEPGGTSLGLRELSRRDAAVALVAHTYRADPTDRAALEAQLDEIVRLAPPVWQLSFPRGLARAADVASLVAAHGLAQR